MTYLLTLNTGSSSVKFRLYGWSGSLPLLGGGKITDIGGRPQLRAKREGEAETLTGLPEDTDHVSALNHVLRWLSSSGFDPEKMQACAHRIVHGGDRFSGPAKLDENALSYLKTLIPLAPLHQGHNLAAVEILARLNPGLAQYGCFDTAFHARRDALFSTYALPAEIRARGVRRYGFHGLSYEWVAHCLHRDFPNLSTGRVVAAHLGNGSSLCAMNGAHSIDTTMGMTALEGLPMGTRCGSIDPGVVIFMQRDLGLSLDETERLLYEQSGLKGLSGLSNDVKTLLDSGNDQAKFALDFYALKAAQHIAAMAVSLGGLDGVIFTGGIGENAQAVRDDILRRLAFLPPFEHHIVPANEERAMALGVWELYAARG